MIDSLLMAGNAIHIVKNDQTVFDSTAKSVQLFPDHTKIALSRNVVFPSLIQGNAYHRYEASFGSTYCESWSTLLRQEWGPDEVNFNFEGWDQNGLSTRNLPQELLGTVPAETDYLDVRIRLDRTVSPPVFWNTARPYVLFEEGDWVNLPGGSCPTEFYSNFFFRHFDIVMSPYVNASTPRSVYLRRFQSVGDKGTTSNIMPSGGAIIFDDSNVSYGWTTSAPGSGATNPPARAAWLAVLADQRGPDTNGGKRRFGTELGRTNQCYIPGQTVSYPDLQSVYSGDIHIHPGRQQ